MCTLLDNNVGVSSLAPVYLIYPFYGGVHNVGRVLVFRFDHFYPVFVAYVGRNKNRNRKKPK